MIFPERLQDNLLNLTASANQKARRKAMVNAFSGDNLEIMRDSIKVIFKEFIDSIEKSTIVEHDLRKVACSFFEKFVCKYIFGKNISTDKLTVNVINLDDTIHKKTLPVLEAIENIVGLGLKTVADRMLYGVKSELTHRLKCNMDNWRTVIQWIDNIVKNYLEEHSKKANKDEDPTSVIDIMLQEDVYKGEPIKMANDLFILIFGALDTSRNAIIFTMSYFIKNKASRDKVLDEVAAYAQMKNIDRGAQMNPTKDEVAKNFKFLNRCVSESLRMNPPGPITEQYVIKDDVEFDGIKWKKDTMIFAFIWALHHDEEVWHQPEKFLPERFDPEHKLFKTPFGEDRPEFSFVPFSLGARKCLGYHFALLVIPIMIMNMLNKLEFEHVDKTLMEEDKWPLSTAMQTQTPPIKIKMTMK